MVENRWVGVNEEMVPDGGFFFPAPSGLCPAETTLGRGLTLVVDSDSCFLVDVWGG